MIGRRIAVYDGGVLTVNRSLGMNFRADFLQKQGDANNDSAGFPKISVRDVSINVSLEVYTLYRSSRKLSSKFVRVVVLHVATHGFPMQSCGETLPDCFPGS